MTCEQDGQRGQNTIIGRIKHFIPAWHTLNMGTGIIAILFHELPFLNDKATVQYIALVIHMFNVVLFVIFLTCDFIRYVFYPRIWYAMIMHTSQSLFLGALPMGTATVISASTVILYDQFKFGGEPFLYFLWCFWWLDVVLSLLCCFGQLHIMFTRQKFNMESMTSAWLLPIVTLIVASSTGAVISNYLQEFSAHRALFTLGVCVILVIIGITFASMVLVVYLQRLVIHGLPEGILIFSAFLPLGPLGQSGFAFITMGGVYEKVLAVQHPGPTLSIIGAPQIIHMVCFIASFSLWSLATAWMLLAIVSIAESRRALILPFKITFWGMIFPNGVYANLTIQLGNALDSRFFHIWGLIYFCFTFTIWIVAVCRTIPGIWTGDVFQAPCLLENPTLLKNSRTGTVQETPTMVEKDASEPRAEGQPNKMTV